MAGGGLFVRGARLYELMLIPLSSTYSIFRYDQLVHMVGFGVATLLMYELIAPIIAHHQKHWARIFIVVIMAGLGVGAFNEILEFVVGVIVPQSGVGGYINTSLDLVADFIGAILAMMYVWAKDGIMR